MKTTLTNTQIKLQAVQQLLLGKNCLDWRLPFMQSELNT